MDLCDALSRDDIRYCHWKSTDALDRSSTGQNDLDLLIAEDDVARFEMVLRAMGFLEAVVRPSRRLPGVRHFYGLDGASGRLVDVHAHERLVLGDDATKNYRLPIEEAYVATAEQAGLFMVPAPELEFAVFIVRMMLKHGSPEAIATGRGVLSDRETKELRHLSALSDAGGGWQLLHLSAPMLAGPLLERCVTSFEPGAALRVRLRVWRELARRLAPFARRSRTADAWLQLWRRVEQRSRSHLIRRPPKKRLIGGGRVVALIGSDGSGKSTAAKGLEDWLSPVFSTARIHLGKPRRSLSWLAVRAGVHLARRTGVAFAPAVAPPGAAPMDDEVIPTRSGRIWLLMGALTARDRRRTAQRARRLASRGWIVICDRYPLPQIAVDGPRGSAGRDTGVDGFSRRLIDSAERQYAAIPPPDAVVVLKVTPEIAAQRRPEAEERLIAARAREILDAAWGPDVVVVDASQDIADVLRDIKSGVWAKL